MDCFIQRHPCLFQDLGGNQFFIIGDDTAGINQLILAKFVSGVADNAVAGDAWFIAHNGTTVA